MKEYEIIREEDLINFRNEENIYVSSWVEFEVDFSIFSNLKTVRATNKKRSNLGSCVGLNELCLSNINKSKDDLSKLTELKSLEITRGNISDIGFLTSMNSIETLRLNYLYKLADVSGLIDVRETLQELEIQSCKRVNWDGELGQMKQLRKLMLAGFEFENLEWVNRLPNLVHLALVDSNVVSGDISPAKNIEYVGIDNRRHYNYRFDRKSMSIVKKR